MRKIFCLGFGCTGTNTLHTTAEAVGLRCLHDGSWARSTWHPGFDKYVEKHSSLPPADHPASGEFHAWQDYDFFSDGVVPLFKLLETLFPSSYFILNTRSRYNWLTGMYNHLQRNRSDSDYTGDYIYEPTAEFLHQQLRRRLTYHNWVIRYFKNHGNFATVDVEAQEESEVRAVLQTAIGRSVERLHTTNVHKHSGDYESNPAVVEAALTMCKIPPNEWHLSLP